MAGKTKIEWATDSWNPIAGCSVVSPGCTNCYAMNQASRIEHMGTAPHYAGLTKPSKGGPVWTGEVRLVEHLLDVPLRWKRPRTIFVNSMSDLFHESVPDEWIDRVFAVMARAPQHTFQVLTKRSQRMRAYFHGLRGLAELGGRPWPLPNVWLGVSCEDQARANERIPDLLETPATVRFVSAEPLLGPISFAGTPGLGWVIIGGESGPDARPFDPRWAEDIIGQCRRSSVPVFMKQMGSNTRFGSDPIKVAWKSRKGGDPAEWPERMRVREMPG